MTEVLFICQHNAGRSQLAAALLQHHANGRYTATSAGITPANTINPAITATMAELGMNITDRVPRMVQAADLDRADIVVLMKPGLTLPATPRGTVLQWAFPDPTSWNSEHVRPLRRAVADRIDSEILRPRSNLHASDS